MVSLHPHFRAWNLTGEQCKPPCMPTHLARFRAQEHETRVARFKMLLKAKTTMICAFAPSTWNHQRHEHEAQPTRVAKAQEAHVSGWKLGSWVSILGKHGFDRQHPTLPPLKSTTYPALAVLLCWKLILARDAGSCSTTPVRNPRSCRDTYCVRSKDSPALRRGLVPRCKLCRLSW